MPFCNLRNAVGADIRSDLDAVSKPTNRTKKKQKIKPQKNFEINKIDVSVRRVHFILCLSLHIHAASYHRFALRPHCAWMLGPRRTNIAHRVCCSVGWQFWLKLRRKILSSLRYIITINLCMHQLRHTKYAGIAQNDIARVYVRT